MSRQWSMQAELSISNDESKMPTKENRPEENIVRMVYTITTNPPKSPDPGRGIFSDSSASYGFQRGNLTFTSTPPNRTNVQDSGYNSDLPFSSNPPSQHSARTYLPYERRCKSTCSITLSTDFATDSSKSVQNTTYCAHPCYFVEKVRDTTLSDCEECKRTHSLPPRSSDNYSSHFCTKLPEKSHQWSQFGTKDMMTQTVETKEVGTSPLEIMKNPSEDNKSDGELSKFRKKNVRNCSNRNKSSNVVRRHSDMGSNNKNNRNVTRSPGILFDKFKDSLKTQTVHIDVYCTASDGDTDSDSTIFNSDEEMDTVYTSDRQKITHRRAHKSELPYSLQEYKKNNFNIPKYNPELIRNNSYSGDESSTTYPSALSSYSTISDCDKSFSTTYPNWCDRSVSNCTLSEVNTSIGDPRFSISDSESIYHRKFDLRNDSSYVSEKSDTSKVPKTDSFDYADYTDVHRIKKMEQLWDESCEKKNWKSPHAERKHKLQQQKIQEYIERKLTKERNISESSDSSDESENSTVIIYEKEPNTKANLTRGSTITKSTALKDAIRIEKRNVDKSSVERSTSSVPDRLTQTLPRTKAPEYLDKAKKFDTVTGVRNLGRHIGPAKNPDCLCFHCLSYYSENGRNRTRSVGNTPFTDTETWRHILKPRKQFTDY